MSTAARLDEAAGSVGLPVAGSGRPGVEAPELAEPRERALCTDCGLSRSSDPGRCGRACQFINGRYRELERQVHGRSREEERPDELHFGPYLEMVRARLEPPRPGSQWTGVVTTVMARLLEEGRVDAVLATASAEDDRWEPVPVIVTEPEGMAACRGMKMGFSPVLALLDEVEERGIRRLGVVGIPCQVHALRALEPELELDELYVAGTPCSDNTTTERFHHFLGLLTERPEEVTFLEFMPDYTVEIGFADGAERRIPFLDLPISELPDDFIPLTCRSCMDYVNALSDLTVGYMGGDGDQWLLVRNERGREMLALVEDELRTSELTSGGRRRKAVEGFLENVERAAGGLPTRRAPKLLRPIIHWAMQTFGASGLEFARARVEMKYLEGITLLRRHWPRRLLRMVPDHAWELAAPYGVTPEPGERPEEAGDDTNTTTGGDGRQNGAATPAEEAA